MTLALNLLADAQFAGYAAAVVLGLIFFLVLLGRLSKAGDGPATDVDLALPIPDPVNASVNVSAPAPAPAEPARPAGGAPAKEALEKTVVLPPAAPTPGDHPPVDLHMYETLVRRIGALEGDIKREPLFLDPLLKRVAHIEKHMEALAEQITSAPPPAEPAPALDPAAGYSEEFMALKEKVYGLQKILEHLAEGSGPTAAS